MSLSDRDACARSGYPADVDRADWDKRYAATDLVWGASPNRTVEAELSDQPARGRRALDLACGEGRNALWLAERGWRVTAADFSRVAIERARKLADQRGLEVDWQEADVAALDSDPGAYALVIILYLQVPEDDRSRVLDRAVAALAPGGELLMIGHALRNLAEGAGGPSSPDVLWDPARLRAEVESRGLAVACCDELQRPVEGSERDAIDVRLRARAA